MSWLTDEQAVRDILEIGRRMYAKGFAAGNDGNISARVGDDEIWATPSGVSKGFMTEDMLVKMKLDGTVLEGTWKPSSEVKMHLRIYRENPDVRAVVHAHPPAATAFACAGLPLDRPLLQELPDKVQIFFRIHSLIILHASLLLTGSCQYKPWLPKSDAEA